MRVIGSESVVLDMPNPLYRREAETGFLRWFEDYSAGRILTWRMAMHYALDSWFWQRTSSGAAVIRELEPKKLISFQREISRRLVGRYVDQEEVQPIGVVLLDGDGIVIDGNHRAVSRIERGTKVKSFVADASPLIAKFKEIKAANPGFDDNKTAEALLDFYRSNPPDVTVP